MPTTEVDRATKKSDICAGCGACCAPGILGQRADAYLEITPDDLKDGFKSEKKLIAKDQMFGEGGRLFLPVIRGDNDFTQCEHLGGEVLGGAACGCYDSRPTACRIFEPGGVMCQRLRQAWLVYQDQVMWEKLAHPEYNAAQAAYEVVARNTGIGHGLRGDNRVLESLGEGPDYVYLRKMRDEDQHKKETKVECLTLDPPTDTVAQGERKRMAQAVGPAKRQTRMAFRLTPDKPRKGTSTKKGVKSAHTNAKPRSTRG